MEKEKKNKFRDNIVIMLFASGIGFGFISAYYLITEGLTRNTIISLIILMVGVYGSWAFWDRNMLKGDISDE